MFLRRARIVGRVHVLGLIHVHVSGDPFWTLVAETNVEEIDDFFAMEQKLMASESLRTAMAGYHDIVSSGRREISRIER